MQIGARNWHRAGPRRMSFKNPGEAQSWTGPTRTANRLPVCKGVFGSVLNWAKGANRPGRGTLTALLDRPSPARWRAGEQIRLICAVRLPKWAENGPKRGASPQRAGQHTPSSPIGVRAGRSALGLANSCSQSLPALARPRPQTPPFRKVRHFGTGARRIVIMRLNLAWGPVTNAAAGKGSHGAA